MKRPYTILLGGGTASGKSGWARRLADTVPGLVVLGMDRYYRDLSHLPERERSGCNFDAPESFELELLVEHIRRLKHGESVDAPVYDFATHARVAPRQAIAPPRVLLVEGILALAHEPLLQLAELKLYMDVPEEIAFQRRLRRDMESRGRTADSIRAQYERSVRPMHRRWVLPSRERADLIMTGGEENTVALRIVSEALVSILDSTGEPS